MGFSQRIPTDLAPTDLSSRLAARRDAIDLTVSNPTVCGLDYPVGEILAALARPDALFYDPQPLGAMATRAAITAYLEQRGQKASPSRLALTASTSEAYGYLFKLLCDPGDSIATPAPSYPLVEHLAALEGVHTVAYRLQAGVDGWHIDCDSVREILATGSIRALVVISPHNPTGSVVNGEEAHCLRALCAEHGIALISDEVFGPYGAGGKPAPSLGDHHHDGPLTFVLDGLSKAAALPQLKLAWIRVCGPHDDADRAMAALEWIGDTYLSIATPIQLAAPRLLELASDLQRQINERLALNRQTLTRALVGARCGQVMPSQAGWYAVLRMPCEHDEEDAVTALAEKHGVLVHPGFFYDFLDNGHLVVSLLPKPHIFAAGAAKLGDAMRAGPPTVV